jgi:lipid-A-disaccharide synthase-like uncharacterized protein
MDWFNGIIWHDGKFLGIEWNTWKVVGWAGNMIFLSRFYVQWYATEKKKQVVVPVAFWWLSLIGTLIMFAYATFYKRDSVLIFAYAFAWIPYSRNLVIHHRHQSALRSCPDCGAAAQPNANYCHQCGRALAETAAAKNPPS